MKFTIPPILIRVWMPVLFLAMMCLFFQGMAPEYWLISLPLLLLLSFMNTLADVHDVGNTVRIKRWWTSIDVPKGDIAQIRPSFLDGIGVLQLRRFVFPWGRIYFVADWSNVGTVDTESGKTRTSDGTKPHRFVRNILASLALAVSGFISARAISANVHEFTTETLAARIAALIIAGTLFVLFAATWTRWPSFANVVLFVATWIGGLVHW
jgi:hypothetical protein